MGRHRLRVVSQGLIAGMLLLFFSAAAAHAQSALGGDVAGSVWRLVRSGGGLTSPQGTTGVGLRSVAASDERFVVVGAEGTIAHSTDGNGWDQANSIGSSAWLADVAWGGGRFVAVGGYRALYSTDGDRWNRSQSIHLDGVESVAWGNDRFVAVGGGGTIAYSLDGDRWQWAGDTAARADLHGIAWGAGRYVAVGNEGTIVHSADGQVWQMASESGTSANLYGVAWNGERYVAVGWDLNHTGTLLHSLDGDHWEPAIRIDTRYVGLLHDVAWNGQRFVAVGSHALLFSTDGGHWQPSTHHGEIDLAAVAGNAAGFVAVSRDGSILRSADGVVWESATGVGAGGTPLPDLHGVAWGGDRFVAVGGWQDSVLHSPDGQEWLVARSAQEMPGLRDVVWDGIRFVGVGNSLGHSSDGDRWQPALTHAAGQLEAVAWSGDRYVAVGRDGLIMHSGDGDRWVRAIDSATTEDLSDVAWSGERFVAVGHHGIIVHSSDGDRWHPASRPAVPFREAQPGDDPNSIYYYFSGVAWSGDRFVAVGWGGNDHVGTVVQSRDGDSWELAAGHDELADEHFEAVAWNGRRFVAVSYFEGTIMYSVEGDRWEPAREIATVNRLNAVAAGGGRFVAVGENGTIVVSP